MIKVTCKIEASDGNKAKPSILVHSHWQNDKLVVLTIDGVDYDVKGRDLITAVENCTNTAKFA